MSDTNGEGREEARPAPPSSLRDYAADAITERLDRMLSHVKGVRHREEIEPVHQMRVWSRRTRASLEVFRGCFPGKAYAELEREVKAITDALGEARDLDVMIETLDKREADLPEEQRAGLEMFIQTLVTRRNAAQRPVEKALARLEKTDLARRFAKMSGESAPDGLRRGTAKGDAHG